MLLPARAGASPRDQAQGMAAALSLPVQADAWSEVAAAPVRLNVFEGAGLQQAFAIECICTKVVHSVAGHDHGVNHLEVFFDGSTPVALRLSTWIDIDASGLISAEEAAARAREHFEADGQHVEEVGNGMLGYNPEEGLASYRVPVTWVDQDEERMTGTATVDAESGEVLGTSVLTDGGSGSPSTGPSSRQRDGPSMPLIAVVAVLALAALAAGRRR
jgi:hypothetical protein